MIIGAAPGAPERRPTSPGWRNASCGSPSPERTHDLGREQKKRKTQAIRMMLFVGFSQTCKIRLKKERSSHEQTEHQAAAPKTPKKSVQAGSRIPAPEAEQVQIADAFAFAQQHFALLDLVSTGLISARTEFCAARSRCGLRVMLAESAVGRSPPPVRHSIIQVP